MIAKAGSPPDKAIHSPTTTTPEKKVRREEPKADWIGADNNRGFDMNARTVNSDKKLMIRR